jgi:hypothetical protein
MSVVPFLLSSAFLLSLSFFIVSLFSPSFILCRFLFSFVLLFPFLASCFFLYIPLFSFFLSLFLLSPSLSPHSFFLFVSLFPLMSLSILFFYSTILAPFLVSIFSILPASLCTIWWNIAHSCSCFRPQLSCIQVSERWQTQNQSNKPGPHATEVVLFNLPHMIVNYKHLSTYVAASHVRYW